jgi:hypothetical protein
VGSSPTSSTPRRSSTASLPGLVYTYSNYPIVAGIAAPGAGVCTAGLAIARLIAPMRSILDLALQIVTAALALALLPLSFALSPVVVVWVLAAALLLQIAIELARHEGHPGAGVELD